MSEKKSEELIAKYLAGETTLEEEEILFSGNTQQTEMKHWFGYLHEKRAKAPAHLKDNLLAAIEAQKLKKLKKRRFLVSISSLAASIVIIVAVSIGYSSSQQKSYEEKEALLKEALSMFPAEHEPPTAQRILYEDDMVIIYTESK
ncbi:MAG: hypothetical protein RIC03_02805 [Cyclobacteriaceae bacterium]